MELEGKVAIVTGGAGGIGEAIVRAIARKGAKMLICDINEDGAKKLEESLLRMGGAALAVRTDISDDQQVRELAQKALSAFGRIDILVNNAGVSPKHEGKKRSLWEMDVDEWRRVIDVDLNGYFFCCHEIVPHIIPHRWGRIVNISSLAARTGGSGIAASHYATAKAGILGMTKSLAAELGPYGITVNAVAPGRIDTPMIRDVSPEVNARLAQQTPLRRLGTAEDIAGTVMFLISEAASFITGATIDVNGGRAMY
jgi:3-oxoacyl-[acyl-carrier protein] reductase